MGVGNKSHVRQMRLSVLQCILTEHYLPENVYLFRGVMEIVTAKCYQHRDLQRCCKELTMLLLGKHNTDNLIRLPGDHSNSG